MCHVYQLPFFVQLCSYALISLDLFQHLNRPGLTQQKQVTFQITQFPSFLLSLILYFNLGEFSCLAHHTYYLFVTINSFSYFCLNNRCVGLTHWHTKILRHFQNCSRLGHLHTYCSRCLTDRNKIEKPNFCLHKYWKKI